jgi:DNA-binding XRE family transcriptional regulator
MLKPIPEFPGYFVDDQGNIFSQWVTGRTVIRTDREPKKLKPIITVYGYRTIVLVRDGKHIQKRIARLVLEAFVGPAPNGLVARHGVNGKKDDSLGNLRWGTQEENMADKRRDGTLVYGERQHLAKLTYVKAQEIRSLAGDFTREELAKRFGVHKDTIRDVINGRVWKTNNYERTK